MHPFFRFTSHPWNRRAIYSTQAVLPSMLSFVFIFFSIGEFDDRYTGERRNSKCMRMTVSKIKRHLCCRKEFFNPDSLTYIFNATVSRSPIKVSVFMSNNLYLFFNVNIAIKLCQKRTAIALTLIQHQVVIINRCNVSRTPRDRLNRQSSEQTVNTAAHSRRIMLPSFSSL